MDDQESSSGLMIGMIVGGVVLLALIVVVMGGAVFWIWEAPRAAMPAAPVAVMEEAPAPVEAALPAIAIQPALAKDHERLVGTWETTMPDGTISSMSFGADGTLLLRKQPPGDGAASTMACTWEVLDFKGNVFQARRTSTNKTYVVEQSFEFQGMDRMVIQGPFPPTDRWVVPGADGKATYQRKR